MNKSNDEEEIVVGDQIFTHTGEQYDVTQVKKKGQDVSQKTTDEEFISIEDVAEINGKKREQ